MHFPAWILMEEDSTPNAREPHSVGLGTRKGVKITGYFNYLLIQVTGSWPCWLTPATVAFRRLRGRVTSFRPSWATMWDLVSKINEHNNQGLERCLHASEHLLLSQKS